jgi:RNA polymerase sigma-70 factor (ECF subfamily)
VRALDLALARPVSEAASDGDDLIERLRRGDRAAISTVYAAHHEAIRAFARRFLGERAAAEDVVHDTFVALPKAIGKFRGDGALRTFLIGIAVNHARRHIRTATRRRGYEAVPDELAPTASDGRGDAVRRVLVQRMFEALDDLPIDQRVAFVLCDVEERSAPEVAAIVGVPEATVRTRLFHARRKLRLVLGEEAAP